MWILTKETVKKLIFLIYATIWWKCWWCCKYLLSGFRMVQMRVTIQTGMMTHNALVKTSFFKLYNCNNFPIMLIEINISILASWQPRLSFYRMIRKRLFIWLMIRMIMMVKWKINIWPQQYHTLLCWFYCKTPLQRVMYM